MKEITLELIEKEEDVKYKKSMQPFGMGTKLGTLFQRIWGKVPIHMSLKENKA